MSYPAKIFTGLVIVLLAHGQAQAQDDENYASIGVGYQFNTLKNAYGGATPLDDVASGINVSFMLDSYGEGQWYQFDASGLLMGGLAAVGIMKVPGVKLQDWDDRKPAGADDYYFLNDKFFYGQLAWSPGKQNFIGPTLQAGFEALGIVQADKEGKGKPVNRAIGNGQAGALSMGTGINIFNPLGGLVKHSRLTCSYDWFLARDANDKFGFGDGRKRISIELSTVVNRWITLKAYYRYFDYAGSYVFQDGTPPENILANSVVTTYGVMASLNWLHW